MATAAPTIMLAGLLQPAFGQSAAPGAAVVLDPIVVTAPAGDTSTATERSAAADGAKQPGPEEMARARLDALAGGTALITQSDVAGRADVTIADTLATVPGVVTQSFFGGNDQPRIQIRGSGLQQNPVE
ncbi:MAG: TonB-dependent receptor plug domain-containing protein, partial [Pseudolabrys sp.]|nr:TonB-dependent receptor plug domain-containing protein [Pseudolabrys sp.]